MNNKSEIHDFEFVQSKEFEKYCFVLNKNVDNFLQDTQRVQEFLKQWYQHIPVGTITNDKSGLERIKHLKTLKNMLKALGFDEEKFKNYAWECFKNNSTCTLGNDFLKPILDIRRQITEPNGQHYPKTDDFLSIIPELKSILDQLILELKWRKDICNSKKSSDSVLNALKKLHNQISKLSRPRQYMQRLSIVKKEIAHNVKKFKKDWNVSEIDALKKIRCIIIDLRKQNFYAHVNKDFKPTFTPKEISDATLLECLNAINPKIYKYGMKTLERLYFADASELPCPTCIGEDPLEIYGTELKKNISHFLKHESLVQEFLTEWNNRYARDVINNDTTGFLFPESVEFLKTILLKYVHYNEFFFDSWISYCSKRKIICSIDQANRALQPLVYLRREISEPEGRYYQGGTHNGLRSALDYIILEILLKKDFCNSQDYPKIKSFGF